MNWQSFVKFWFPLLGYSGIIFYVSGIPSLQAPPLFPHADKVFHMGEYTIFGFLAVRAFTKGVGPIELNRYLSIGFLSTLIYAASDELHQHFVPGRSSDLADLIADCVGGMIGVIIYFILVKYLLKKKEHHVHH